MNHRKTLTTFLLSLALAATALAHDTWLIPDRFVVARDSIAVLDLTSGMAFPALDTAIKPERVNRSLCRIAGRTFDVAGYSPAPKSLRFSARLVESGIATFSVELKPRSLELTPRQVREYLDEIGAPEAIRQAWANGKRPKRWREVYTKHSKTFIKVGEIESDRSWAEPIGMFLEIVPEKDPTSLRIGDEFPVRVLKDGAPVQGFALGIVHEGGPTGKIEKTDSQGQVSFRLDRTGRWLLRGTDLRKASQAGADWESDFTTLTIHVGSK